MSATSGSSVSTAGATAAEEEAGAAPAVDAASAHALELPALLALVAELAATDAGRDRVERLAPTADAADLERRRARYREAEALLADGPLVPAIEAPLVRLEELLNGSGRELDGGWMLCVAEVLEVTGRARRRVREAGDGAAELGRWCERLPDGEPLRRRIARTLDRRGEVRDDATPELARLRRRVRKVRDGLYQDLQQLVARHREHLSEETIPLKEGRLVLLLQAGARGRLKGLQHGRSGSGQSFYFEPLEVVEANNDLQEALEEEAEERRRVLAELVDEVQASAALVAGHLDLLAELDLLQAAARFAAAGRARPAEIGGPHDLVLRGARHPLLDPALAPLRRAALGTAGHTEAVVPLDLELSAADRVLVVTGPNAGGKTVVLKTVGLLSLASQCGLPVPAESGTRLPLFAAVTAAVGDEQDLLSDRSTFSGRLLRWRDAWTRASPEALVLLDELGSGTDPEEGAALAVAMLEGLLDRRPLALVTTHLSKLAAAALEQPGARCAAMELDAESGRPTFRLRPGTPGGSEALTLAARLGLPRRWLRRAEEILGPEHRDLRRLLAEVEAARRDLVTEQDRLASERRGLEGERRTLAAESEALADERRRVEATLRREFNAFRRKVNERLRAESERLRREFAGGRKRGLVAAAAERLFEAAPSLDEAEPEAAALPVAAGALVRHRGLGWEGRVGEIRGGVAEVAVAGKRVRCRVDELVGVAAEPQEGGRRRQRAVAAVGRHGETPEVAPELNLVGRRVEPALAELDGYLDRALLGPHDAVRVIHGFGTGRLRDAVRERLREHPAVAGFRPGKASEGGDGATVVKLGS